MSWAARLSILISSKRWKEVRGWVSREGLVDRKQQVAFWALSPRKWIASGAALLPEALREKKGSNFRWETLNFCSLVCFSGLWCGWMGNVHNRSYSNYHIWYYLNISCSYLCCKQCIRSLHKSVDVLLQDDLCPSRLQPPYTPQSHTPISIGVAWPSVSTFYSLMILEPNPSFQIVFPVWALYQAFLQLQRRIDLGWKAWASKSVTFGSQ